MQPSKFHKAHLKKKKKKNYFKLTSFVLIPVYDDGQLQMKSFPFKTKHCPPFKQICLSEGHAVTPEAVVNVGLSVVVATVCTEVIPFSIISQ